MARFARTLSTLLTSGVPILQAMETTAGTVDNVLIQDAILAARARPSVRVTLSRTRWPLPGSSRPWSCR